MKLCGVIMLSLLGLLFIIGALVLQHEFPSLMTQILYSKLTLRKDSTTIENFLSNPVPIFMQFYFFNLTNEDELLHGGVPKVNEIGPYTYEETRLKYDLIWDKDNASVTYKENKSFFFRANMSNGLTEEDYITTVNPLWITLATKLESINMTDSTAYAMKSFLDLQLGVQKVFITKKVGELLYSGYEEYLLLALFKLTGDPLHKKGRFGFFFPKNNSDDGTFKIYTGENGMENIKVIDEFRGIPSLDYWSSDACNIINGTDGSQFPLPITNVSLLNIYSTDLCRSLYFKFENITLHGDLQLYRYVLPYEVLENSPTNECFCTDEFTCKSSMVNLAPCKKGAPVVASTPHFYMADDEVISSIDGLSPSKDEHETYVDVEPNTGIVFRAHKRIQINMPLRRYSSLPQLSLVKEVILPILWLNESVVVPEKKARLLQKQLTQPGIIVRYSCYGSLALGGILLLTSVLVAWRSCRSETARNCPRDGLDGLEEEQYDSTKYFPHLFTDVKGGGGGAGGKESQTKDCHMVAVNDLALKEEDKSRSTNMYKMTSL